MSTDKANAKNGAIEVEETFDEDTPNTQDASDDQVSNEAAGKSKEKDLKKKTKGRETKKEPKESDSNSVKEGKARKRPKDEKSEDEDDDNEDDDDDDDDEGNEENEKSKDGKVPLLDQPLELSGTRERKKVQRFSEEYKAEVKDSVPVEIPDGKGALLGSIARVEHNVHRSKPDILKAVHKVLFNRVGKANELRKNIRKFNGFDFDEESDHYAKKKQALLKFDKRTLQGICSVLDLKFQSKRDEVAETILSFLMNPADTGLPVKARPKRAARVTNKSYSESDDEQERKSSRRGKKKRASLKEVSSDEELDDIEEENEGENEVKNEEENEKDAEKSDIEENNKDGNKKRERKVNDSNKDAKENSSDVDGGGDDDGDHDEDAGSSEDSDEPKSRSKKGARSNKNSKKQPAKKATAKKPNPKKAEKKTIKKRAASDEESSEDEPLMKKTKAPPTDEEIKTYVKEILEGANLEETTMKIVCKQVYAHYPDFDLAHKKDFIKNTVKSLIST